MNIYLLGMMGSGKSTVGRALSQYMDMPFIDLDLEIEQSVGKTISEIFKNDGEKYFRNIESNQLYQYFDSVVACGGGIILNEGNRTFIKKMVKLFYSQHQLQNYQNGSPLQRIGHCYQKITWKKH